MSGIGKVQGSSVNLDEAGLEAQAIIQAGRVPPSSKIASTTL